MRAIPALLPQEAAQRKAALAALRRVVGASGRISEEGKQRLARVEAMFDGGERLRESRFQGGAFQCLTARNGPRRHERYERLIAVARELKPTRTAVVHPCNEVSLESAVEAQRLGLIDPILVGPAARIREEAAKAGIDLGALPIIDAAHSHDSAAKAVELVQARQGGGADEGQPAHRRADGRGGRARRRHPHRAAHQPCLRHGRAGLSRPADHHRRRHQYRADPGRQGRYRAERDRSGACPAHCGSPGRDPARGGDRQPPRCPRPSTRPRCARWPNAARSRGAMLDGPLAFDNAISPEAARDKGHRLDSRRAGGHPAGARSGSRQHAGQKPYLPGRRRRRRHRAGRRRADHPDQPRRFSCWSGWPPAPSRRWSPRRAAAAPRSIR